MYKLKTSKGSKGSDLTIQNLNPQEVKVLKHLLSDEQPYGGLNGVLLSKYRGQFQGLIARCLGIMDCIEIVKPTRSYTKPSQSSAKAHKELTGQDVLDPHRDKA